MAELRDLRVHACALNARDLDALASHALRNAPCICDGEWVGEGPEAVRRALEREFAADGEVVARLGTVDGEPAVLEFDGSGSAIPRATLRFRGDPSGRIRELRIDHGERPARPRPGAAVVGVPEPDI